jgi:DNA mismatch repair protein MutS
MPSRSDTKTPMMQQFQRIKAEHSDAIVFFRLGDFYEMFYEDAETASSVLEITLTARNRGRSTEAPMCGVPYHAASGYIARLLDAGFKVAIAEQVSDPATTKGMLDREVVRVMTPGTLVEDDFLSSAENNYVVALVEDADRMGLAALELSTGEFVAAEFDGDDRRARARDEIERWAPKEVCYPEGSLPGDWIDSASARNQKPKWTWSPVPPWTFDSERAGARLREQFGVSSLAGYDLEGCHLAVGAAGALLHYAGETQRAPLSHLTSIRRYREREALQLDATTRRTLELVESWQERSRDGSLLDVIDESVTAMGSRRLRQWLLRPLRDVVAIEQRQEFVEGALQHTLERAELRSQLASVRDIERLTTRATMGNATPRDLAGLRSSLQVVPEVRRALEKLEGGLLAERLLEEADPCEDVHDLLTARIVDDPPLSVTDGGVIREGFDAELDRLRLARSEGKDFIAGLQAAERDRTGISSLKVGFNKVFGYYLEVSKANLAKVPDEYIRKQTLVNAERFITPALKEFEESVLTAEEKIGRLEAELFDATRQAVAEESDRLYGTAAAIGSVDALTALADVAAQRGYARPLIDDSRVIEIRKGRHPVVEVLSMDQRFVPNDTYLDDQTNRIQILTGPNMGGKSTYLRQVALIVILGQMGGFVPAESARIGCVDRIFTRVGASDNLVRGASTFLVEMEETANILHNATPDSLVILDEVGRGTSTYDGLALAWAVIEYLQNEPGVAARTLFATHYHELTALDGVLPSVRNLNVAAHEGGDGVVFLHRVEPGPADRSYGIHVARLAGLPGDLVIRATEILSNLEATDKGKPSGPRWAGLPDSEMTSQLTLFEQPEHPVVRQLRGIAVDAITPLEALNLLAGWKAAVDRGTEGSDPEVEIEGMAGGEGEAGGREGEAGGDEGLAGGGQGESPGGQGESG